MHHELGNFGPSCPIRIIVKKRIVIYKHSQRNKTVDFSLSENREDLFIKSKTMTAL